MKVMQVYTDFNIGGAQKVIVDISRGLKAKKCDVIVVSEGGEMQKLLDIDKIHTYNMKMKRFDSFIKLYKVIKVERPDIIHSHHRYCTAILVIICKIFKIKLVHTEHNEFKNKKFVNLRGTNIIAVSEKVKENMIKSNVKDKYITVISNGAEVIKKKYKDYRKKLKIKNSDFVITIVARLSEEKGHEFFLNSVHDLIKKNNIKVLFVGDGNSKVDIQNKIKELDLCNNIKLVGNVDDISNIILATDIFVLPSKYEGLPITILEVMSEGKIVVATNVGGNSEVIKNEINGFLFNYGDKDNLYKIVEYIYENRSILTGLQINAKKTVCERYSNKLMIDNYFSYYRGLI